MAAISKRPGNLRLKRNDARESNFIRSKKTLACDVINDYHVDTLLFQRIEKNVTTMTSQ